MSRPTRDAIRDLRERHRRDGETLRRIDQREANWNRMKRESEKALAAFRERLKPHAD